MGILDAKGRPIGLKECPECHAGFFGDVCPVCSSRSTTNRTITNIIGILEAAKLIKRPGQRSKKRRSGRSN